MVIKPSVGSAGIRKEGKKMISDADIIKYVSENQGKVTTKELKEKFDIGNITMLRLMREKKICWFPVKGTLYVWLHYQYKLNDTKEPVPETECPCERSCRINCTKCQDLPSWFFDNV